MLAIDILDAKKFFTKAGQTLVDLTRRSVSFFGVDKQAGELYVVEPESEMRPDLIAHSLLGSIVSTGVLLKYNGISNPFSIEQRQVIRIPKSDDLEKFTVEPDNILANRSRKAVDIVKPKTAQDAKRIEYLRNRGALAVPPSVAIDESVRVVNGKIVFGSDVTSIKKEDCPDPISRARLKETLLKNKIFG
jgi:hypothetical protein